MVLPDVRWSSEDSGIGGGANSATHDDLGSTEERNLQQIGQKKSNVIVGGNVGG